MHKVVHALQSEFMSRNQASLRVDVRAIDVGYSNVKFTTGPLSPGRTWPVGTHSFPSLAPRLDSPAIRQQFIGMESHKGLVVEVDGHDYFVGEDASLNSTGVDPRTVDEDYSCSPMHLALIRGALAQMADRAEVEELSIDHLVLALPLNTFSVYRERLAARATGEHLIGPKGGPYRRVTVSKAHVIVQPHGALLNYGVSQSGKLDGFALVVDVGGGTLDWYFASKDKSNWVRSGAYPKAMLACSYAILDQIEPGLRDQFQIVDRVDRAIRESKSHFTIRGREYLMSDFAGTIDLVLEESMKKMMAKLGTTADVDVVLLTGGGAKVLHPLLLRSHPKLKERIKVDDTPVFSNVCGFHIYGELVRQRQPSQ